MAAAAVAPSLLPAHGSSSARSSVESGHSDIVHDAQIDYYGKRLATCSSDRTIRIFAIPGGGGSGGDHTLLATLSGHDGPVWQISWGHPKFGSLLASCSYDRKVIIWKESSSPNQWSPAHIFTDHDASVNSLAWAPHEFGLALASASSDGSISVRTGKPDGSWELTKIPQAHPVGVTSVSWSPPSAPGSLVDGSLGSGSAPQKLVSGGCDNTVKVWRLSEGNNWKMDCFPPLSMHGDWVRDVAWAPNLGLPKNTIASCSQDGSVVIWVQGREGDRWEGKVIVRESGTPVWRVSWSLTGNVLAVADAKNSVSLWKEAVDGDWVQVNTIQ